MKIINNLFLLFFLIFFRGVILAQTPCEEFIKTYTIIQDACNPRIVHFTNQDTAASSVSWNFGDGSTGFTNEISHEYKNYGEYEVTMLVHYPDGCSGKISKQVPVFLMYDYDLISTESQTICPGQSIQLKTISSQNEFCWLSNDGLSNISERSPVVKPEATTTYRLQTKYAGRNLVINSGFEEGNFGFTSEYEYRPITDSLEKQYAIITNSRDWHGGFESCSDHTPGGGNLMVVNGSPEPNAVVWSQNVSVLPNTNYEFSLWIASVNKAFPAKLKFQINGVILDENVNIGSGACEWNKFSALWNSEGATQAEIRIINVNTSVAGNDFALDDITFFPYNISYDEIIITVAPEVEIKVDDDKIICKGESIRLMATGGKTYSWSPIDGMSDPKAANPFFSPTVTTHYTVTGYSEFGCSGTANVMITPIEKPAINIGEDVTYCEGGSYQIPGVVNNANNISWSPTFGLSDTAIANPHAAPTKTTTYVVKATNGYCTTQDQIIINVAEAIQINTIDDTTFCGHAIVSLTTTAITGVSYQWTPTIGLSNPAIASPVATLSTGIHTYKVTVTSPDGCVASDEVTITVIGNPTIAVGPDASYCEGGFYQIPGVVNNASNIVWSPATGLSDATIANPIAMPVETTTYKVTATNGNCTMQDEITIHVAEAIQVSTMNDMYFCGPATVQLNSTEIIGANYLWTPVTGLSDPGIASPMATVKETTTYAVNVFTDEGCKTTAFVTVTINEQPTINAGNDITSCEGSNYLIPGIAKNATNIRWFPSTGLSDSTIANPIASPLITTTYIVSAKNNDDDCISSDTVTINVAPSIQLIPVPDTSICIGSSVQLPGIPLENVIYKWTPAIGLSDTGIPDPIAKPDKTTLYILKVTNDFGCEEKDSVLIKVVDYPVITMNKDVMICLGQTIKLQAKAPGVNNFKWWPEDGLSDPQKAITNATINSTFNYKVTAINPEGCASTDSVTITAAALPIVRLIKSNDIDCSHGEVQLVASGGETYKWSHGSGQNNINSPSLTEKPRASTEYHVTAISQDGCEATASVVVVVKGYPIEDFYIPNAFTPNGDGVNDCFGLRKANLNNPFQFQIFNRWGRKVFETTNLSQCWDGTLNGVVLAADTFVWQIKVRGECGDLYKKGTVVLIR